MRRIAAGMRGTEWADAHLDSLQSVSLNNTDHFLSYGNPSGAFSSLQHHKLHGERGECGVVWCEGAAGTALKPPPRPPPPPPALGLVLRRSVNTPCQVYSTPKTSNDTYRTFC